MLAIISRLVEQKGIDLLMSIFDEVLAMDIQLVVLGQGDKVYENFFREKANAYPDKVAFHLGYEEPLARKIYASADIILMPSRFEPCGISQMIAMRYGTVPIVRETGGLCDTVLPLNEFTGQGNGFSFQNYNAHEFLATVKRAVGIYQKDDALWKTVASNAAKSDFSWNTSANKYHQLYKELLTT